MVYAMYDITATKSNPGYGFANSKKAVSFTTSIKLADFLESRKFDFSAKRITRKEAMTMLESVYGGQDKGLTLDSIDMATCKMVVLRSSKY